MGHIFFGFGTRGLQELFEAEEFAAKSRASGLLPRLLVGARYIVPFFFFGSGFTPPSSLFVASLPRCLRPGGFFREDPCFFSGAGLAHPGRLSSRLP
jgi:hypothetical protein